MCSCLRQIKSLPKEFFIPSRISSIKFFSALSTCHKKSTGTYDPNNITKINPQKCTQQRNFSVVQSIQSFYDYVRLSEVSEITEKILVGTHDFTGLPWYAVIIGASALMKLTVAVPCGIMQHHLVSKLELTKIQLHGMVPSLKQRVIEKYKKGKCSKSELNKELLREVKREWKSLVVENNCHPLKSPVLFFVQFPFWLILTLTLRTLSTDAYINKLDDATTFLQFQVGGTLWFKNLILSDPTFILPIINLFAQLAINELSFASRMNEKLPPSLAFRIVHKGLPIFLRLFSLVFFFICAAAPSSLALFWTTNSLLALLQNLAFMSPKVRRFLRIPKVPSEKDRPYKEAWKSVTGNWMKVFTRKE